MLGSHIRVASRGFNMNFNTLIRAALLSGFALVASACAHEGHERTASDVASDTTITTKVKSALLAADDVKSFDISVKTFDGTVQLSGFVDSQWQIDRAVQIATAVRGVQDVRSSLIHKPAK